MITRNNFHKSIMAILFSGLIFVGCSNDDDSNLPNGNEVSETSENVVTIPFFIQTELGELPSNPDDLIYDIRENEPIVDVDGNHMTLEEFSTVNGSIDVTCIENEVTIDVTLRGLIPHGVYTLWHVTFNEGGLDPAQELLNIRGIGAVGAGDGSDNYFIASPDGTARISAVSRTPNNLSMIGDIRDCPLVNEEEWHVVGSYHMDGKTWGPNLGPDGTVVEQFGFVFRN